MGIALHNTAGVLDVNSWMLKQISFGLVGLIFQALLAKPQSDKKYRLTEDDAPNGWVWSCEGSIGEGKNTQN